MKTKLIKLVMDGNTKQVKGVGMFVVVAVLIMNLLANVMAVL